MPPLPVSKKPGFLSRTPRWLAAGVLCGALLLLWIQPRWWLNLTHQVDLSDPVSAGQSLFYQEQCLDCHRLNGEGAYFAPDLDGLVSTLPEEKMRRWLENPQLVKLWVEMPNPHLSDAEISTILAYLRAVDAGQE